MAVSTPARIGLLAAGAVVGTGAGYLASRIARDSLDAKQNSFGQRLVTAGPAAVVGAAAGLAALRFGGAARPVLLGVALGSLGAAVASGSRTIDPYSGPESQRPQAYGGEPAVGDLPPPDYTPRKGDVLPDLRPLQNQQLSGWQRHDGSGVLEFSTTSGNFGQAALELSVPAGIKDVRQTVYNVDGTTRQISLRVSGMGTIEAHADEGSLMFDDYAKYELLKANPDGSAGAPARESHTKMSFYITETDDLYDAHGYGELNQSVQGAAQVQGMGVGKGDTYGMGLCGQTFDTTGLAPGDYVLRQTINPNHRFLESNYSNNVLETLVTLHEDGKVTAKRVITEPDYTPAPLPESAEWRPNR